MSRVKSTKSFVFCLVVINFQKKDLLQHILPLSASPTCRAAWVRTTSTRQVTLRTTQVQRGEHHLQLDRQSLQGRGRLQRGGAHPALRCEQSSSTPVAPRGQPEQSPRHRLVCCLPQGGAYHVGGCATEGALLPLSPLWRQGGWSAWQGGGQANRDAHCRGATLLPGMQGAHPLLCVELRPLY